MGSQRVPPSRPLAPPSSTSVSPPRPSPFSLGSSYSARSRKPFPSLRHLPHDLSLRFLPWWSSVPPSRVLVDTPLPDFIVGPHLFQRGFQAEVIKKREFFRRREVWTTRLFRKMRLDSQDDCDSAPLTLFYVKKEWQLNYLWWTPFLDIFLWSRCKNNKWEV